MIIGRETELAKLRSFVTDVEAWPRALILEGEPGIGKTTLWDATLAAARDAGCTVLRSSPSDADAAMAFVVLADLLKPLTEVRDALPEPQRHALAVALVEADATGPTDPRAVAAGVLSALRSAARSAPVIVAIDDVQWVDPESDRAFAYAFRRLDDVHVCILVARRVPAETGPPPQIVRAVERTDGQRITLGPFDAEAIAAIVHEEHPSLSRLELEEIHTESGGNPFYAAEFARSLRRGDERPTGLSLPVPKGLRDDVVRSRFADLSPTAMEALLIAASATRPTVALVEAAMPMPVGTALAEAQRAAVIRIDTGAISFRHPLYRSATYADASRAHRHRVHAALAAIVDDPEERGRQLSLSADAPDDGIADEIEAAAASARARGAPAISASLLEHAIRLTPAQAVSSLARRLMMMGKDRCLAGDTVRGLSDLSRAVALAEPGAERASALAQLGAMEDLAYRHVEAKAHLEAALREEGTDDALRCYVHATLSLLVSSMEGDEAGPRAAVERTLRHADEALALARTIGELEPRARAYAAAIHAALLRDGRLADELVAEAPDLWEPLPALPMSIWPRGWLAYALLATGEHTSGRELLLELLDTAVFSGDDPARAGLLALLAGLTAETGEWRAGIETARRSLELEEQLFEETSGLALVAWFEAAFGEAERARENATRSLERVRVTPWTTRWARGSLGMLESSLGRPVEALSHLEGVGAERPALGTGNPAMSSFLSDLIDSLVVVGRVDEAEEHTSWLEERGSTLDRPYASAVGARGRGLIEAARGDLEAALASIDRALKEHERLPMPYELGRTLLVQGSIQRRAGMKRLARETLEHARSIFDGLGAALWSKRVNAELGHITGRRPGPGKLTDAERNVSRLAAAGFRNREIAEQLFLSVRTVEGHLSDTYGKLGIRSRTELAAYVEDLQDEGERRPEAP